MDRPKEPEISIGRAEDVFSRMLEADEASRDLSLEREEALLDEIDILEFNIKDIQFFIEKAQELVERAPISIKTDQVEKLQKLEEELYKAQMELRFRHLQLLAIQDRKGVNETLSPKNKIQDLLLKITQEKEQVVNLVEQRKMREDLSKIFSDYEIALREQGVDDPLQRIKNEFPFVEKLAENFVIKDYAGFLASFKKKNTPPDNGGGGASALQAA